MARLLMAALRRAGHRIDIPSRLRSWNNGDPAKQHKIRRAGERTARRLVERWSGSDNPDRPDLWFTYHLYHKAPDWLGPAVSEALAIPYIVAEASVAGKQAGGPWDDGLQASKQALSKANAVFALSDVDADGLDPYVRPNRLHRLTPFIDTTEFDRPANGRTRPPKAIDFLDRPLLLAIGMMRDDAKLASYKLLGQALAGIANRPWTLVVVGDGPARSKVERALPPDRTVYFGMVPGKNLPPLLRSADMVVWPAINEAYGMSLLEAQAAGLPVVAGASGGVPDIVANGVTGLLTSPGDATAFGQAVARLIDNPAERKVMGSAAYKKTRDINDIAQASTTIDSVIRTVA